MAGYTSAPSLGGYGNINAANYGQYNNQGYDTSGYGNRTAPGMSLAQAAWINSSNNGNLRSPYAGTSNLEYMSAVSQRAQMFWDQAGVTAVGTGAYAAGFLGLNAGSAFMQVGSLIGKSGDAWKNTFAGNLGKGMHAFGKFGEEGIIPRLAWHGAAMPMGRVMADVVSAPFAGAAEHGGAWAMKKLGGYAGVVGEESLAAYSQAPGQALAGYIRKGAGGTAESILSSFTSSGKNLFAKAANYAETHGVASTLIKSGARVAGGLFGTMAYFTGVDAALNMTVGGVTNMLQAGDAATAEASLTFQSLKGKMFNNSARGDAKNQADIVAESIRKQVSREEGITSNASRFFYGHRLDGAIEKKTALYGMFAENGLVGNSKSGGDFVKKAQELEKAVKSLARAFKQTTSETIDSIRVMKSQGISDKNLVAAGENTSLTAGMSGYSAKQVMAVQSHGTEEFRGTVYNPEVGVAIANDVIQRTSISEDRDAGWKDVQFSMRGKDSLNVFLTRAQSKMAKSSNVRKLLIASMYRKSGDSFVYTGEVNKEAVYNELSGQQTYLSNIGTQNHLVKRYMNQLTTNERNAGDQSLQSFTSTLSAGDMSSLIGSAFRSVGHESKEAGMAAFFVKEGLSPKLAAQLAKSMARETGNNMVAETYKQDAINQLNAKAGVQQRSTSIAGFLGSNFDMGMASTLFNFTGSVSDRVFGKGYAGVGEAAVGIGGIALGAGASALSVGAGAGLAGSLMYGYNNRDTVGKYMFGATSTLGKTLSAASLPAVGMLAATGMKGYLMAQGYGALGASATVTGLGILGYIGGKTGSSIGESALGAYYGETNASMIRNRRGALGAASIGGGAIGGTAAAGLAAYMLPSLSLGLPGLAFAGLVGAGAAAHSYYNRVASDDLLAKREQVVGAAKSVSDLALLQGTDLLNVLGSDYATVESAYQALPQLRQVSGALGGMTSRLGRQLRGTSGSHAKRTLLLESLSGSMAGFLSSDSRGKLEALDKQYFAHAGGTVTSSFLGRKGTTNVYGANAASDRERMGLIMASEAGSGDNVVLKSKMQREIMQGMSYMYNSGNNAVKEQILDSLSGMTGTVSVATGIDGTATRYDSVRDYLENSGGNTSVSTAQLKTNLGSLNKMIAGDDISLGQATELAYIMDEVGGLSKSHFKAMRSNQKHATYSRLANETSFTANQIYNILGTKNLDTSRVAITAGRIGYGNKMMMLNSNIQDTVSRGITGPAADTVTDILMGNLGNFDRKANMSLLGALEGQQGRLAAGLTAMATASRKMAVQSRSLGNTPMAWKEYKSFVKEQGMQMLSEKDFLAASGGDKAITGQELLNYSGQRYVTNRVSELMKQENAVAPEQAIEEITKNTKSMTGYLQVLADEAAEKKASTVRENLGIKSLTDKH